MLFQADAILQKTNNEKRLFNCLVSIIYKNTKESIMLQAHNMNETKNKVYDLVMKAYIWNYKEDEFYLECHRIRILERQL